MQSIRTTHGPPFFGFFSLGRGFIALPRCSPLIVDQLFNLGLFPVSLLVAGGGGPLVRRFYSMAARLPAAAPNFSRSINNPLMLGVPYAWLVGGGRSSAVT